jgi:biopolymer transport protein ExbD
MSRSLLTALLLALLALAGCKSLGHDEPDLTVTVAADGTTRVDGERVAIPDLPLVLRRRGITTASEVVVLTHPDAPVRYVAEVLTAFSAVGFSPGQVRATPMER